MKITLIALLFAVPALANDARPYQFEVEPGCVWNKNEGRCVVQNRFKDQIKCTITVSGKTEKGLKVGNTHLVSIPAKQYNDQARVYAKEGDALVSVTATADCTAQ